MAVVALGKLSDFASQGDSSSSSNKDGPNSTLMALWAPLLLLHLGGPDTITAFSVEDIQLWLRHLVGLVVQVALGAEYSKVDIDITYLLLVGAVLLELMISSEWMILWMQLRCIQLQVLAPLAVYNVKGRRWSGVVGQLEYPSLRDYPDQKMLCYRILRLLGVGYAKSWNFCFHSYVCDFDEMKIVIIEWVRERVGKIGEIEPVGTGRPGELTIKKHGLVSQNLWGLELENDGLEHRIKSSFSETIVHVPLERYNPEPGMYFSVMYRIVREEITGKDNKWEILSELWAEMLCHGAARCPLNHHYENIRRGGEFLTHVWLLLTWHGLTDLDALALHFLQKCASQAVGYMDSSSNDEGEI
ncbi:hypothetical protein RJ639_021112 [Escallonia herrerae]|uniref:DUF4220 domain-containing protein n=1 Tax=Escallonia herrerae TaxID=1293975 RepID=A0AA89AFS3_9ASTE|nr:hypothetical protein RJ639_021112 [Escallonia herrerae]